MFDCSSACFGLYRKKLRFIGKSLDLNGGGVSDRTFRPPVRGVRQSDSEIFFAEKTEEEKICTLAKNFDKFPIKIAQNFIFSERAVQPPPPIETQTIKGKMGYNSP